MESGGEFPNASSRPPLGKPVAEVGIAEEDRELVADQFAATAGDEGRQADQARPSLLAMLAGEPSHTAVVREHEPAD